MQASECVLDVVYGSLTFKLLKMCTGYVSWLKAHFFIILGTRSASLNTPISQDLPTERRRSALSGAIFGTAGNDLYDAFADLHRLYPRLQPVCSSDSNFQYVCLR